MRTLRLSPKHKIPLMSLCTLFAQHALWTTPLPKWEVLVLSEPPPATCAWYQEHTTPHRGSPHSQGKLLQEQDSELGSESAEKGMLDILLCA